jgi:hypothetical protein
MTPRACRTGSTESRPRRSAYGATESAGLRERARLCSWVGVPHLLNSNAYALLTALAAAERLRLAGCSGPSVHDREGPSDGVGATVDPGVAFTAGAGGGEGAGVEHEQRR